MRRIFVHFAFGLCVALAFLGTIPAADAVPSGPYITVGDVSVVEGSSGAAVVWVPVDLSVPSASLVTVMYTVTSTDPNTNSSDFAPKTGKLTFLVGVTFRKVSVTIYGDTTLEGNQDVEVHLSAPVHASISDDTGEVLIIDDDSNTTSAAVSIGSATVTEADGGVHYAYVPLTLSAPAAATVRIVVTSACGTAPDPAPLTQTVGFALGQRSKILKYRVNADTNPETLETAIKQIRVKSGAATVKVPEGVLTIDDNDGSAPEDPPLGESDRISVSSTGAQASFSTDTCGVFPSSPVSISGDGRFVLFVSGALNLVPNDTNSVPDLFVRDRVNRTTERVDVADDGSELSLGGSPGAGISDDGRYVSFSTSSPELGGSTTYGAFVRDRVAGTTTRASVMPDGSDAPYAVANGISPDGRYVPFVANGTDLYVRDLQTATTRFVATGMSGWNSTPMSADDQQIAFVSRSDTLVPGDTNGYPDVFVANLTSGAIQRVNLTPGGAQESGNTIGPGNVNAARVAMSRDGRYVVFWSASTNMGVAANNTAVFLRDRVAGTTERASVGIPSSLPACFSQNEGVSNDGRYVSFSAFCEQIDGVPRAGDLHGTFVRDRTAGTTTRVDALPDGTPANLGSGNSVMSADGRYVAYASASTNLVPDDTNHMLDVFIRRIS